ncbi:MAG: hypothetical protein ACI9HY_002393, partial [Planctomycetaceae bacterium]
RRQRWKRYSTWCKCWASDQNYLWWFPALKFAALRADVITRLKGEFEPGVDMLDEEVLEVLKTLLNERQPDLSLA